MSQETAITTTTSPMHLLEMCIGKGYDPDRLGQLMLLVEKWQAMESAKAFGYALEKFQEKMPVVPRLVGIPDKQGNIKYKYASYEDIMDKAQPILTECGISIRFTTEWKDKMMTTTCHVRVGTHVEVTDITLGLPEIPMANDAQKAGGALSYGKRMSLVAALNIRIVGEDNDGASLFEPLSPEQTKQINDLFEACRQASRPVDKPRFFHWLGVEDLNGVKASDFQKVVAELKRKAAGK